MGSVQDIIEKIRKLQAKATNAATTEAEAAMFANKVQEMLAQHNLEHVDIRTDEEEKANVIEEEVYGGNYQSPWRALLANAAANFYFCKVYTRVHASRDPLKNATKFVMFVGKPHNRAIAISMFSYLQNTVGRLARDHSGHRGEQMAFERGCGIALSRRIKDEFDKLKRPQIGDNTGVPMLYRTELQLVEDFLNRFKLTQSKGKYDLNSEAARAGMAAAKNISLTNQLDVRGSGVKLLG